MSKEVQDRFYINIPGMEVTRAALREGEIRFEKHHNMRGVEYWGTRKDAIVMLQQVLADVVGTLAKLGAEDLARAGDNTKNK